MACVQTSAVTFRASALPEASGHCSVQDSLRTSDWKSESFLAASTGGLSVGVRYPSETKKASSSRIVR